MRAMVRGAMLSAALLAVVHATHAAQAAGAKNVQQREATPEERGSFDAFYRARLAAGQNGAAPLFAPAFDISRRRGDPWQVIARVESAPRHYTQNLCRQIRSSFIYDAKAPREERWGPSAAEPEWHVWLTSPSVPCSAARYTTVMHHAVPPADVEALLRQHRDLLLRARLLFAGNSECARQRALTFRLSAIKPAAPANGAPVMFGLVFESDRDTIARVAVRKSRGEYAAWNVSCRAD